MTIFFYYYWVFRLFVCCHPLKGTIKRYILVFINIRLCNFLGSILDIQKYMIRHWPSEVIINSTKSYCCHIDKIFNFKNEIFICSTIETIRAFIMLWFETFPTSCTVVNFTVFLFNTFFVKLFSHILHGYESEDLIRLAGRNVNPGLTHHLSD